MQQAGNGADRTRQIAIIRGALVGAGLVMIVIGALIWALPGTFGMEADLANLISAAFVVVGAVDVVLGALAERLFARRG